MHRAGALRQVRAVTAIVAFVIASVFVLFASGATTAQPYGPAGQGTLSVSDETVDPGQPITISGSGFRAASSISVVFGSLPTSLGTATSDASGAFVKEVTIPADAASGSHTITATGPAPDGGTRVLSRAVTVQTQGGSTQPAEGASGGALPRTGTGIAVMVVTAIALCAAGSLLVLSVHRRRKFSRV